MAEVLVPGSEHERVTLVELVNRVVDRGIVLGGDITISVAEVDLLYLGLRVLLCSPERVLPPADRGWMSLPVRPESAEELP